MNPEKIELPVWWDKGNGHCLLREGLPADHPESPYNYLKREYPGIEPELYGVFHPSIEKYKDYTREMLMSKICELESFINTYL